MSISLNESIPIASPTSDSQPRAWGLNAWGSIGGFVFTFVIVMRVLVIYRMIRKCPREEDDDETLDGGSHLRASFIPRDIGCQSGARALVNRSMVGRRNDLVYAYSGVDPKFLQKIYRSYGEVSRGVFESPEATQVRLARHESAPDRRDSPRGNFDDDDDAYEHRGAPESDHASPPEGAYSMSNQSVLQNGGSVVSPLLPGTVLTRGPPSEVSDDAQRGEENDMVITGLLSAHHPTTLRRLRNPLNASVLMVALLRMLDALHQAAVSAATLAGAPYDTNCPRPVKQPDLTTGHPLLVGSALPAVACDVSASFNQFIDAFALCMMAGFFSIISFPRLSQYFAGRFATLTMLSYTVSMTIAILLVIAMWATLKPLPTGSRFAPGLSWCWIPDDDITGNPNNKETVEILRFACSYVFVPVFVVLGISSMVRLSLMFSRFEKRHKMQDASHWHSVVRRRLLPQLLWYFIFYSIGGLIRLTPALASDDRLHAAASFLYPTAGGVIALLWAYGEGILAPVVFGRFAKATLPRKTLKPFSLIVLDAYAPFGEASTDAGTGSLSPTEGARRSSQYSSGAPSPEVSTKHFAADDYAF